MDKKLERIKQIPFLIFIIILLIACIGWITNKTKEDISLSYEEQDAETMQWVNADTGLVFEPGESAQIPVKESLTITSMVPKNIDMDAAINYYDPGFHVTVLIEDRVIYEAGADGNVTYGKETGALWRSIPISRDYVGQNITFTFENLGHSTLSINPEDLMVRQSNDVINEVIKASTVTIVETAILIILTVFLGVFGGVLIYGGYRNQGRIVGSLSLLSLVTAGWLFFDGNISQLFIHSGTLRYMLSYICFTLIPVFCGGFFMFLMEYGKKFFGVVLSIYEVLMSVAYILSMTHVLHISNAIVLVHMAVLVECLGEGIFGIITLKKEKSVVHVGILISFVVMAVVMVVGIAAYYAQHRRRLADHIGAGFLVFVLAITVTEIAGIARRFRKDMKLKNFNEIARIDTVTGGNSRTVADEWLKNADFDSFDSVWFVHMDLTHFSAVNAVVGWSEGDRIISDIYRNNLKYIYHNDLECNAGNAGFGFILTNMDEVDSFCKMLTGDLTEYLEKKQNGLLINVEYAAMKIKPGDNLDFLLDSLLMAYHNPLADYNADSNCYYYNDACREQKKTELEIESKVPAAIKNGEFVMYLQPKVRPGEGTLGGAEALVRWNSPEGLISPGKFIPVLEKSGQIRDVDLCMFRQVCEYLADRKKKGLPQVEISVNVSKFGIIDPNFFDAYLDIINETNAPTEYIEFEFTESMAFDDMPTVERLIQTMHVCGARVSMDDFGSAYSNLGAIGRLKFDLVKLDKKFFDNGFPANESDYLLVKGLIQMFHNMNLKIVCEGVEEKAQCDALREMGADLIQGFYYAKPMPKDQYSCWKPEEKQ